MGPDAMIHSRTLHMLRTHISARAWMVLLVWSVRWTQMSARATRAATMLHARNQALRTQFQCILLHVRANLDGPMATVPPVTSHSTSRGVMFSGKMLWDQTPGYATWIWMNAFLPHVKMVVCAVIQPQSLSLVSRMSLRMHFGALVWMDSREICARSIRAIVYLHLVKMMEPASMESPLIAVNVPLVSKDSTASRLSMHVRPGHPTVTQQ
jgi:hypothetical protein